jgi:hypothetical protein
MDVFQQFNASTIQQFNANAVRRQQFDVTRSVTLNSSTVPQFHASETSTPRHAKRDHSTASLPAQKHRVSSHYY